MTTQTSTTTQRNTRKTKENAFTRLDGNDLLHATFTRPDWRTPPTKQHRACCSCCCCCSQPKCPFLRIYLSFLFWIFFFFFIFIFFSLLFFILPFSHVSKREYALKGRNNTGFFSLSLSSLFRINIRKGERKRKNRMRRVKRERKNSPPPHTHENTASGEGTWLDFSKNHDHICESNAYAPVTLSQRPQLG